MIGFTNVPASLKALPAVMAVIGIRFGPKYEAPRPQSTRHRFGMTLTIGLDGPGHIRSPPSVVIEFSFFLTQGLANAASDP
ncbi:hypothetical protein [Salinicola acroporae]|uniref:hypothetical protein n=1 Tax=Salinicola acroporae TaxID=1541440 RepID=UPI0013A6035C|nr:hypothetical protein [Salinicola acroporae]